LAWATFGIGIAFSASSAMAAPTCGNAILGLIQQVSTRGLEKPLEDWNSASGFNSLIVDTEKMGQVTSYYDRKLETRVFYTSTAMPNSKGEIPIVDPESPAVVVFFHGSGTMNSGGVNFVHNMNKLANIGYSAISFDMPFHAEGPIRDQMNDAERFMRWIDSVIKIARDSGKPVYLVGHSFGPEVIAEYLYRYPFGASGAALISPAAFNKTLQEWYRTHTSKMKFGGEVPENTLGGEWADRISQKFSWNRKDGLGDPTTINPDLKIEVLSGDREEYVPGPVGGKNRTPTGPNTYDLKGAIQPFFRGANIVIEPGAGHYLFDAVGADGQNVVSKTIYSLLSFDGSMEQRVSKEVSAKRSARPYYIQLERMIQLERPFQAWLKAYGKEGLARSLVQNGDNSACQKLISTYQQELRAKVGESRR
jgi:pimeloyl-ACP methyl ester carboxylesterase